MSPDGGDPDEGLDADVPDADADEGGDADAGSDADEGGDADAGSDADADAPPIRPRGPFPGLADALGPETSPRFPETFGPFEPPLEGLAAEAAPRIAEWTRTGGPGDTLVVTGEALSSFDGDDWGRDTRFLAAAPGGAGVVYADGAIRRLEGRSAAITLSPSLPDGEMYLLWPGNDAGWGEPVRVNGTEAWWVGPATASPGERFSVYGRDLALGGGASHLYIEELDRWLESEAANPYKADFVLPADVAPGTYTIWAHNGHGREMGWSRLLTLTVVPTRSWDGPTIDVTAPPYDARGDGVADDYEALAAALADCPEGGTVYLPAGTYLLGTRLRGFPSGIRLLGDGPDATIIADHPSYVSDPAYGLIHAGLQDVEVRGIGFEAREANPGKILRCRGSRNVQFHDCRFSQVAAESDQNIVDFSSGSEELLFEDCTFFARRAAYFGSARGLTIRGCDFYGLSDTGQLLTINGADEVSITGSSGQHYDTSDYTSGDGWSQGRFITGSGNEGTSRNVYIGGNRTVDMCPRYNYDVGPYGEGQVHQNAGEHIMFEALRTRFRGAVAEASADTVRVPGLVRANGEALVVVEGPGFGQSRRVVAVADATGTVTIDEPWRVQPDATSLVMVGNYNVRFAIYDNHLDGVPRAYDYADTRRTATAGVSLYGAFLETVVAANVISEVHGALLAWSLVQDTAGTGLRTAQPNYFNLFVDNDTTGCASGMVESAAIFGDGGDPDEDVAIFGNVWRRNRFQHVTENVAVLATDDPAQRVLMSVFDHNEASDIASGAATREGSDDSVWVGNRFTGPGDGAGLQLAAGHVPALTDNAWDGFGERYDGALPGPILEVPVRVVELWNGHMSAEVELRNAGTSSLEWTATTESPWLRLEPADGVIADERGAASLRVTADGASGLEPGVHEAVVTVSGGGRVQRLTVSLDVEG